MKKIYIGPSNIANLSNHVEKSLRSHGFYADFITWSYWDHPFEYEKTKVFRVMNQPPFKLFDKNVFYFFNEYFLKPFYFLFALIRYDIFLFIKPATFLRANIDLKILKFFNKKVGIFYVGCPDRDISFDSDPEYICNTCRDKDKQKSCLCNNINKKIAQAIVFEKYADYIIGPPDTVSYVQDKNKVRNYRYPMPAIIINGSDKNFNGRLRISHLPSNPLLKGTHIIEPILNKLAEENDIEIIIKKETWAREKVVHDIKNSHIVIDSVVGYVFGTICLEAVQYGCVPLNAYPDWIAQFYEIPPVVKITGATLHSTLQALIDDRVLLKMYAERSQQAYNKYFIYQSTGKYYKEMLDL